MKKTAILLMALLLVIFTASHARKKDNDAYRVAIKLHVGGQPITGFLHSINDSLITIIPGIGGKKGIKMAMEHPQMISIPVSLIKKLSVARVRSSASLLLPYLGISVGYTIAYVALIPPETVAGVVVMVAVVTVASIYTMGAIYSKTYKPTELGFTITMQKYCLVKSGIVADGQ
jgi:hypothetical protein